MSRDWTEQVWREHPPEIIRPPPYPERPDLFDEVEWGPYPTHEDTKTAYRLWSLPDSVLGKKLKETGDHPFPRPGTEADNKFRDTLDVLALNVYEDLMRNHRMPIVDEDWDEDAQMKLADDGQTKEGWSYEEIFGPQKEEGEAHATGEDGNDVKIEIEGHDVLKARYWTIARLQDELQRRGLDTKGKAAELRRRLYDDERRRASPDEVKATFLRRTDLSSWGIPRKEDYMLKITRHGRLRPLDMYTWAILLSPYNPAYWVSRSYLFYQMGYLDLALGDAYRAQLLCEILCDPFARNRQPGLYTRVWHSIEQHILHIPPDDDGSRAPALEKMRDANGVNYFVPTLRKALHNIMSLSLKALQCWHDYEIMEGYLLQRVAMPYRDRWAFEKRMDMTDRRVLLWEERRRNNGALFYYERWAGNIGGRPYPYSVQDVDRTSPSFLARLNQELIANNQMPWKRCEVRPKGGTKKELGVYATQDIRRGQIIYADEPSMRGHLNIRRPDDAYRGQPTLPPCDNCKSEVSEPPDRFSEGVRKDISDGCHRDFCACVFNNKDDAEPLVFCPAAPSNEESASKSCLEIARELYHFRVCGKNWKWLHDAMRPNWNTYRAGDEQHPKYLTHNNEIHGTVLSLLLREVFDVTLLRRERTGNPHLLAHEIDELLPLEGEEQWEGDRFPFTLAANIKVPFDILLQLGVNIFCDLTFDTWVIQMVLRKLLLSAVPWDQSRRQDGDTMEREHHKDPGTIETQMQNIEKGDTLEKHDPSFRTLYLFPGLALFNHSCRPHNNAEWAFDSTIRNRVIVWADRNISKDEEITIGYRYQQLTHRDALRLLGRKCECPYCQQSSPDLGPGTDDDDYGPSTPEESDSNAHQQQGQGRCKARTMSAQEMRRRVEQQKAAKEARGKAKKGKEKEPAGGAALQAEKRKRTEQHEEGEVSKRKTTHLA
ncbi:hypothetical protein T310_0525 [Rasamsonia emersonii CBS 393.64]|uniref:Histone-lysine N-methyltransferase SET5 n=1 Tax=Rasamsonia emersonii (strain ATCC 16479 / CBS 393.64 / IMI 116815) TaxID=1408163 RepID=A0A0F4Z4G5_RASE3|nr:hypothetical protein T310_0525 [Rasamsonia emersonii CBS 393.64]KKA25424.1 hypothetical protein T310_0525 [Rasamsonia emersonii CBS 393.64]